MTEKKFALIIANNEYSDPDLLQLTAPARDAEALGRVLGNPSIGGYRVKTFLNKNKNRIEREIENFFNECERDDLVLLYFSCHGIKDRDGQLYFATPDTERKLLMSTAISANFVNNVMRSSHLRQQVLILDCCYSGAFARGMVTKADKFIGIKERFKERGRVVLTSSDAMEYSFEGDEIKGKSTGSIFTHALVQGLETGEADIDEDEWISIYDIFNYVKKKVIQQRPEMWCFDMDGKIIIARNPKPIPKPIEGTINTGIINQTAWSIMAYFELYGLASDIITTVIDFTKILKPPGQKTSEEIIDIAYTTSYTNIDQKFNIGFDPFLSIYGEYVDKDDKVIITLNTFKLRELLSKGEILLNSRDYIELEKNLSDFIIITNELRVISRKRILLLVTELQKGGPSLQTFINHLEK